MRSRSELLSQAFCMPGSHPSLSPTERAKLHEAKQKAKDARWLEQQPPGPSSYRLGAAATARNPSSRSGDVRGAMSAFKSASKRNQSVDRQTGDPGAYDPGTSNDIASTSHKSFSQSARSGKFFGGVVFGAGGTSASRLQVELFGEHTPGPGAYNGGDTLRSGKKALLAVRTGPQH